MKINGKKIQRPAFEVIVIPRRDGDLIIKAQAVLNYYEFDKLCPPPVPPVVIRPNGTDEPSKIIDVNNTKYLTELNIWSRKKIDWMILKSLSITDEMVFETVDPSNSDTWKNVHSELIEAGFSAMELNKIMDTIMVACGLNQDKIDEATKNFLASLAAAGANA